MGKNDPKAIRKIAADSWMPKMNTAKGTHAVIGTARRKLISPSNRSSTAEYQPISTPRKIPVTEAMAKPAATRSRLMTTYGTHVPEYHASAWRGPKIQSHQATATVVGEGSDEPDIHPAEVTSCQARRITAGSAIRRKRRQTFSRAASPPSSKFFVAGSAATSRTGSDTEVCVISLSDGRVFGPPPAYRSVDPAFCR